MAENVDEIFHREVLSDGGLLRRNMMHKSLWEQFLDPPYEDFDFFLYGPPDSRKPNKAFKRIHSRYVNNFSLNAVAFSSGEYDFVGIYKGTSFILHHVFFTLLSHPEILPDIGNSSEEKSLFDDLSDGFGKPVFDRIPKNKVRKRYAQFLVRCAEHFLFNHEIGHIIGGHLEFVQNATGSARIYEVEERGPYFLPPKTMQALELDADARSAWPSRLLWQRKDLGFDELELFRAWGFSMAVLFRLFDQENLSIIEYKHQSHPHPDIRYANIMMGVLNSAITYERTSHTFSELKGAWKKALQDLGEAWHNFRIPGYEFYALSNESNLELSTLKDLQAYLKVLLKDLRPFNEKRITGKVL